MMGHRGCRIGITTPEVYNTQVRALVEAACLTSLGGVLGVALGAGIGLIVHFSLGFPISLPWWSFALGLGFSASIGIFFGMLPAWRASRLDPIEALRHE